VGQRARRWSTAGDDSLPRKLGSTIPGKTATTSASSFTIRLFLAVSRAANRGGSRNRNQEWGCWRRAETLRGSRRESGMGLLMAFFVLPAHAKFLEKGPRQTKNPEVQKARRDRQAERNNQDEKKS
jgi:hypothetical protein